MSWSLRTAQAFVPGELDPDLCVGAHDLYAATAIYSTWQAQIEPKVGDLATHRQKGNPKQASESVLSDIGPALKSTFGPLCIAAMQRVRRHQETECLHVEGPSRGKTYVQCKSFLQV